MSVRKLTIMTVLAFVTGLAGCTRSPDPEPGLSSPEATFAWIRKALVNRESDQMWMSLADSWKRTFEKGRKELLSKPREEQERIAKEGLVSVADLEKMDSEAFFRFYFNYKKRETFKTSAPEIVEKKSEMIRDASILGVEYEGGDGNDAVRAELQYEMGDGRFSMLLVKVDGKWLLEARNKDKAAITH